MVIYYANIKILRPYEMCRDFLTSQRNSRILKKATDKKIKLCLYVFLEIELLK